MVSVPSRLVLESKLGVESKVARRISLDDNRLALVDGDFFMDLTPPDEGVRAVGDKVADRFGGVPNRRRLPCRVGVFSIPLVLVLVLLPLLEGVRGPKALSLNRLELVMVDMDDDDDECRGDDPLPIAETLDCCCKLLLLECLGDGGGKREVVLVAMLLILTLDSE